MRATLACALLATGALALVGCGGASDDAKTPTRAQFIAKTDARCKASNARTRALNRQLRRAAARARGDRDLLRRLAPILERGQASVRDNAAAFADAKPPAGDAARIARLRRLYVRQADHARKLAAAAERGDVAAFRSLSERQREVVISARRRSRAYGFRECGSTKSDPG